LSVLNLAAVTGGKFHDVYGDADHCSIGGFSGGSAFELSSSDSSTTAPAAAVVAKRVYDRAQTSVRALSSV